MTTIKTCACGSTYQDDADGRRRHQLLNGHRAAPPRVYEARKPETVSDRVWDELNAEDEPS